MVLVAGLGKQEILPVFLLCLSTIGLYGGGIVFNDVFDADLDKVERPERAIPSGEISKKEAALLGIILLCIGFLAAFAFSVRSGIIAFLILVFALVYNKYGKHHAFFGPLNMGLCRGLNLLLGISILSVSLQSHYFLGIIPLVYIFSITMISQGEVHGSNRKKLYAGAFLYLIVIGAILYSAFLRQNIFYAALFLILFAGMIFRPLFTAIKEPVGKNIIKVCRGTACHVSNSERLATDLRDILKLESEKSTTNDMLFTLEEVACLGCFAIAG
jgi:4-hydroxybenzoate polyprenyltransferase